MQVTGREPVADLGGLAVGWSDDRPLYLRDVAEIRAAHVDAVWFPYRSGVPACYITLQRTSESNTAELIGGVKEAIAELDAGPLAGEKLFLEMSWDPSVYVRRAIGFVLESRGVESGVADGGWIAVRSAELKQGDQVVVRGSETLRGGERLQIAGMHEDASPVPVATRC